MKLILKIAALALLSIGLLPGQNPNTAAWPTPATDNDLFVLTNLGQGTLNGTINASVTTIAVTGGNFIAPGIATLDSEIIHFTGFSGGNLTGVLRGAEGTTAASHTNGITVFGYISAWLHNQLAAEIKAIETVLAAAGLAVNNDGSISSTHPISTTGGFNSGGATSACDATAGCAQYGQGTAPSALPTTAIQEIAPSAVTSYRRVKLGSVSASGIWHATYATSPVVQVTDTLSPVVSADLNITPTTCTYPALLSALSATAVGTCTVPTIPAGSHSAAYTTLLTDAGTFLLHPNADNNARTFTIDSNANVAYPVGTTLTFVNEINTLTIAITSDTLTLGGTATTGSRTLAAGGVATALKVTSTKWIISGPGLT